MGKNQIQGLLMILFAAVLFAAPYFFNRPEMAHHKILVATEKITKGPFKNSVVLVVHHSTVKARGYIVNGPRSGAAGTGGPVQQDFPTVLHSMEIKVPGSIAMSDLSVMLTDGDGADYLQQVAPPPDKILAVKGYAGWGLGQLDREIAQGDWRVIDFDRSLVFDTPPELMWPAAMRLAYTPVAPAP